MMIYIKKSHLYKKKENLQLIIQPTPFLNKVLLTLIFNADLLIKR